MIIFKKLLFTKICSLFIIGVLLFSPLFSFADSLTDPLVPKCTGIGGVAKACNFCDLIHLGQHIINFLIFVIAPALVVIFVCYGGIMLMIRGGTKEGRQKAKEIITTALWGYVIVLVSWLIINTILVSFARPGSILENWTSIQC